MATKHQADAPFNFQIDIANGSGTPTNVDIDSDIVVTSVTLVRGVDETNWDPALVTKSQNPDDAVGRYNLELPVASFVEPLQGNDRVRFVYTVNTGSGPFPFVEEFIVAESSLDYSPSLSILIPGKIKPTSGPIEETILVRLVDLRGGNTNPVNLVDSAVVRSDGTRVELSNSAFFDTAAFELSPGTLVSETPTIRIISFNAVNALRDTANNVVQLNSGDTLVLIIVSDIDTQSVAIPVQDEMTLGPIVL